MTPSYLYGLLEKFGRGAQLRARVSTDDNNVTSIKVLIIDGQRRRWGANVPLDQIAPISQSDFRRIDDA